MCFWWYCVLVAARRLSSAVVSRGYFLAAVRLLIKVASLSWSLGSKAVAGVSSCGEQA